VNVARHELLTQAAETALVGLATFPYATPSSIVTEFEKHPHAGYCELHVASASLNAGTAPLLMAVTRTFPQQLSVWTASAQSEGAEQCLSKVGNDAVPGQQRTPPASSAPPPSPPLPPPSEPLPLSRLASTPPLAELLAPPPDPDSFEPVASEPEPPELPPEVAPPDDSAESSPPPASVAIEVLVGLEHCVPATPARAITRTTSAFMMGGLSLGWTTMVVHLLGKQR
jgi:hypothetical protein